MWFAALHGFILAVALILPIGMQNGFILTQGALQTRWFGALPAVITAAACDTLLIGLAVLGLSAAAFHIIVLRIGLGIIGILFLLYMTRLTWRDAKAVRQDDRGQPWRASRQIRFACSVSLLNPHALIDTLAVIGGSAIVYPTWSEKISFGVACAVVSWIWFVFLAIVGHFLGRRASKRFSTGVIHRVSAIMMLASAIYLGYVMVMFR